MITLGACQGEAPFVYEFPKENSAAFTDSVRLLKIGQKRIPLDSTIGLMNQSLVSFKENDRGKISIFNSFDASLHIYDYQSGALEKKIKFHPEGNHGIGKSSNMGHYMEKSDSIFLFHHWENKVYLMDGNAAILRKYDLINSALPFEFMMMVSPSSPAFKIKDHLFITCQSAHSKMNETTYLIDLDLKSGEVKWGIKGPEILDKAFWGALTPYTLSLAFDPDDGTIATSFAKDPEVKVFKASNTHDIYNARVVGSKYVQSFKSFPKKDSEGPLFGYSYKEIASETNRTALYGPIIYDPYRELYYRFMFLPRSQEQYEQKAKGVQQSIIITNKSLDKIGEIKLPKGIYHPSLFFINDKGLHIANANEYEQDEDFMVFDIYTPESK